MRIPHPLVIRFILAVRRECKERSLSQLARDAGVAATTISGWLNQDKIPSLDAAARVSAEIKHKLV